MTRFTRGLRRAHADERGLTLAELAVTMTMLSVAATIFISLLITVQSSVAKQQDRSTNNDQARLAVEQMDREIRSGGLFYANDVGVPAGWERFVLLVHTQANATTRTPPERCVQWRIKDGRLQRQSFHVVSGTATVLEPWRLVATGVVNRTVAPTVPAFALDAARRTVDITLLLNSRPSDAGAQTVRVETSVSIRNGSSGDPCTPAPAWDA